MATIEDIRLIYRAMHNADTLAIELDYVDAKGQRSRRRCSPIRRTGRDSMLMMCLTAGQPRQMRLSRIGSVKLIRASDVLIPEPKIVVAAGNPVLSE
jgi:predicted DNA-binding transcriptional regulator YafY